MSKLNWERCWTAEIDPLAGFDESGIADWDIADRQADYQRVVSSILSDAGATYDFCDDNSNVVITFNESTLDGIMEYVESWNEWQCLDSDGLTGGQREYLEEVADYVHYNPQNTTYCFGEKPKYLWQHIRNLD